VAVNFYRLQVFCTVVEHQSISRAAEQLVVTQPVISRLVAELEQHYGTRLLLRSGRRVVPTDAGVVVYRYAKDILQSTSDTERVIADLVDGHSGFVTLGVSTAIANSTFPLLWKQFSQAHPRVEPILKALDSQRVLEDARVGSIDLGLALSPRVPDDLIAEPLGTVGLSLVAPAGHPLGEQRLRPRDLLGQTFLSTTGVSTYETLQSAFAEWGIPSGCAVVRFGDTETVKRGVELGLGIALVVRISVARELASGTLVELRLAGHAIEREILMVQRRGGFRSAAAVACTQFLRDHAGLLLA
jgi:DNA-binding transcriptional LysR family regulator